MIILALFASFECVKFKNKIYSKTSISKGQVNWVTSSCNLFAVRIPTSACTKFSGCKK